MQRATSRTSSPTPSGRATRQLLTGHARGANPRTEGRPGIHAPGVLRKNVGVATDREAVKRVYGELFSELTAILYRHDLVGIIVLPDGQEDEYEPEVGTILPRLRDARGADDAAQIVREEFERWFDPGIRMGDFEAVGAEIWAAWKKAGWGPATSDGSP